MIRILLIGVIFNALAIHAQLVEVPVAPRSTATAKIKNSQARTQALTPMALPFWDDFSFTQQKDFPNDTLWDYGQTVWVNHGRAINPPSIFTTTFDGIDSTGRPHNLVDVQAKGFADKLESRTIKLDDIAPVEKETVYISFFYQVTGRSEAPDRDDTFSLWFKDQNGTWEKVFEIANNVNQRTDSFYYALVKVDAKFQHANFKFKFQNFARLSGPYDIWNLDYVYLNKGRSANSLYFPDRTQVQPISSIFQRYWAIPMNHYRDTAAAVTIPPTAYFTNLYDGQPNQPADYSSYATIISKKAGIETQKYVTLDVNKDMPDVPLGDVLAFTLENSIPINEIDLEADSVYIKFKLGFDSGDTNPVAETPLFLPINFLKNDTTQAEFILHKHYAYDDGTAEYGAGLNRTGTELAYGFPMFTTERDTITAIDISFPEFGDNGSRTVILKIWSAAADGTPLAELHRQPVPVQRTAFNTFVSVELTADIIVRRKFFIGWEQTANVVVPIGLDKNTDSGDDIYFNISGTWEQNQNTRGSLMIHPVFGKAEITDVVNGVNENSEPTLYPNPARSEFYISELAEHISLYTVLGIPQPFEAEQQNNRTRIILSNSVNQLLVVRWQQGNRQHVARVVIKN